MWPHNNWLRDRFGGWGSIRNSDIALLSETAKSDKTRCVELDKPSHWVQVRWMRSIETLITLTPNHRAIGPPSNRIVLCLMHLTVHNDIECVDCKSSKEMFSTETTFEIWTKLSNQDSRYTQCLDAPTNEALYQYTVIRVQPSNLQQTPIIVDETLQCLEWLKI